MMDAHALQTILEDPAPAISERPVEVDPDGWIYDPLTGEVLGHDGVSERWEVRCHDDADFALELRAEIEGNLLSLDARLKAVTEHVQALKREQMRRLSWWDYRFAPSLIAYARRLISGGRKRSAQFTWGKVSFRKTQGTTQILDMDAAVNFVEVWKPEGVKTIRSTTATAVKEAMEAATLTLGEAEEKPGWLAVTPPEDRPTISTGILRLNGGERDEQ